MNAHFTLVILQSAGIRSPTPKRTTSPGTKSFANTSDTCPSLLSKSQHKGENSAIVPVPY